MSDVTIVIDEEWIRRIRSPLYKVVEVLTGVAITFAPMFLYQAGSGHLFTGVTKAVIVILCFGMIYLVPLFYIAFARGVIRQIPQREALRGDA